MKFLGQVLGITGYMIKYGCIAHCTLEFIADFVVCKGPSMEPSIYSDEILISEHISHKFKYLNRGDVIILRSPTNPQTFMCKRISGLAGDRIRKGIFSEVVPRGHVWVLGDNTHNSTDSRSFGAVPQGLIRGKVLCRVWPPSQIGAISPPISDSKNYL